MPNEEAMKSIKYTTLLLVGLWLSGCAAMFVPETSDPMKKIGWAIELFNNQGRPLPAERLIRETIEICEKDGNVPCLGKANVTYGFFFRSPSIEKWEKVYRENGFYDKNATFDNRLVKSKEYFEKGISYYLQTNEYDALTNAYLNIGFTYYFLNDSKGECESYAKSLEYNAKNFEANPDAKVALPPGVSSFKEYVAPFQKRAGCEKQGVRL